MTALSRIAESARNVRFVRNKAMAFNSVKTIIENLTEEQERELHGELARLYATFQPAAPKKPKTLFDWVAKAVGWKDKRQYLRFIYVTDERMIGTDGHRVHIAPNQDGLEPGYYDANGVKVHNPDFAKFPEIDRVVPTQLTSHGRKIVKAKISDIETGAFTSNKTVFNYYKFQLEDNFVAFNMSYVNDMLSLEDDDAVMHWSIGAATDVVAMADLSHGREACIMPMRV